MLENILSEINSNLVRIGKRLIKYCIETEPPKK